MNKKYLILLVGVSAVTAQSATADSSLDLGFNLSYRHLKDSFSQSFQTAPGVVSGFRDPTAPPNRIIDPSINRAPQENDEAFGTYFDVSKGCIKDDFLVLTLPIYGKANDWRLGVKLAYGFGLKSKVGVSGSQISIIEQIKSLGINKKKTHFFEIEPMVGYEFTTSDKFSITPSIGWNLTTYKRKGENKLFTVGTDSGTQRYNPLDYVVPQGSKNKLDSPFVRLEAKFKSNDKCTLALGVRYSRPQVHTAYMVDLAQYSLNNSSAVYTPNLVLENKFKRRANQWGVDFTLAWILNNGWNFDLYGNLTFLHKKSSHPLATQDVVNGVPLPSSIYQYGYHLQGGINGTRKIKTYEIGAGFTRIF